MHRLVQQPQFADDSLAAALVGQLGREFAGQGRASGPSRARADSAGRARVASDREAHAAGRGLPQHALAFAGLARAASVMETTSTVESLNG